MRKTDLFYLPKNEFELKCFQELAEKRYFETLPKFGQSLFRKSQIRLFKQLRYLDIALNRSAKKSIIYIPNESQHMKLVKKGRKFYWQSVFIKL